MDKYSETFETWNKVAKLYEDKFMHLDLYDDTYDKFCEQLPKEAATILEIGCGPGNITAYLLNKRPDFKITGIDISPNMIELAKKNCPDATFAVLDSRIIGNIKNKFDAIVCGFCLPYLSEADVEQLIIDCGNLLNQKGKIYFSFVEGKREASGYLTGSSGDRVYFYYHSLEKLTDLLQQNNFINHSVLVKTYRKSDETEEFHTIVMAEHVSSL